MQTMKEFVDAALVRLAQSLSPPGRAGAFVAMRITWFQRYGKGRVCFTRHGADFFDVVNQALQSGVYHFIDNEYDRNLALILKEHGVRISAL